MTDIALIASYDRSQSKCRAILRACSAEGVSLEEMVRRLERLGKSPRLSLLSTFGTARAELIPTRTLEEYCRRYKIKPAGPKAQEAITQGVTDEYCEGCMYLTQDYGERICNFFLIEHKRRGCTAGSGCKQRKSIRGRKKA